MCSRYIIPCVFLILACGMARSQPRTKNVVIVTLDGLRWQEMFMGADAAVVSHQKYVRPENIRGFWHPDPLARRKLLMPFMWDVMATRGQLYGNRQYGNRVNCANPHLLSYPGYSEMLVGFHHRKVSSNDEVDNPHATVLEVIQRHAGFENEVAAFATWDVFPFILRKSLSGIYVHAGWEPAEGSISRQEKLLNAHQLHAGVRSDSLTFRYALEYLKRVRPRVTLISFDETDQHAHAGRYAEYLRAANRADAMLSALWQWIQSQPDYRDQTTLLITTDHGRGKGKNNWRSHRLLAGGSRHIWLAVLGPDTPALGEVKTKTTLYQNQVAKTVAAFLGLPYENEEPVGEVVRTAITIPDDIPVEASAGFHGEGN